VCVCVCIYIYIYIYIYIFHIISPNNKIMNVELAFLLSPFSLSCLSRWLPPCKDRRPVQWEVPCDQEAGLGTLLHCVAGLGHSVRSLLISLSVKA
jgi:hypothetical protein